MNSSENTNTDNAQSSVEKALNAKKDMKKALQESLGMNADPRTPIICIPTGVNERNGGSILLDILPGLLSLNVQILVLGKGSKEHGEHMLALAQEHSQTMAIIENTKEGLHDMIVAADMALFLADASNTNELRQSLNAGTIPVAPVAPILENYDQNKETGNAFLFTETTMWHAFAAVVRATETYRFPYDWKTIQKHCLAM